MSGPAPGIVGLGTATPAHRASQRGFAQFIIDSLALKDDDAAFVRMIARRSGIDYRHSVILDRSTEGDACLSQSFYSPPERGTPRTTAERMRAFESMAPPVAIEAARRALRDAEALGAGDPTGITHLVTFSCTGFSAPGIDAALVRGLELPRTVERIHIGFMGCHAAINALRAARAIVGADGGARVLLAGVELSSLHMLASTRRDHLVSACLFGDGAAAAVVAAHSGAPIRILRTGSIVFPDSERAMGWTIGDGGFEMTLAESVPDRIGALVGPWVGEWLGMSRDEPAFRRLAWCVHPGGPRVLDVVSESLGLPAEAMLPSREVLREFGNMSSVTTLFILERMFRSWRSRGGREACRAVALGFGPGLAGEAALVEFATGPAGPPVHSGL